MVSTRTQQKAAESKQSKKSRVLTELSSKQFFSQHKIPITKTILATSVNGAIEAAEQIGLPVVMKVISPDIVHKTEAKGVAVDIRTLTEVQETYRQLLKNAKSYNPKAKIYGITVQEMAHGTEFFIGASRDPQFGPTVAFGLGGIYVEVFKDVSFRVVPITKDDAEEMLSEIQSSALLDGVRGKGPLFKEGIIDILLKISKLMNTNQFIREIDINPLIVNSSHVYAADARIVMEEL